MDLKTRLAVLREKRPAPRSRLRSENLAKHYEHRCRDFNKALAYTDRLLTMAPQETRYLQRRERLQRKLDRGRDR